MSIDTMFRKLTVPVTIAMLAHLVAFMTAGSGGPVYFAIFMVAFFLLMVGWLRLQEWRPWNDRDARMTAIGKMSQERARGEAYRLLEDGLKFSCEVGAPINREALKQLAPLLLEFFERYESVEVVGGEMRLARSEIGVSALNRRCLKIGVDVEHTEVVCEPGREEVFQIDGSEASAEMFVGQPTIYHWILQVAEDVHG